MRFSDGYRRTPYVSPEADGAYIRQKRKRGPLFKFAVVFLSVFVFAGIALLGGIWLYNYMFGSQGLTPEERQARQDIRQLLRPEIQDENTGGGLFSAVPARTNFVIMGIDWEGQTSRADTIMVGSFDTEHNELSLISIPRDTHITFSDETRATFEQLDTAHLPRHSVRDGAPRFPRETRINTIWHHFGPIYGPEYTVRQLQEMLGISIHHWVSVSLGGFVSVIDTVGGVYFDVPQRMWYVFPPDEFGIYFDIDLHAGYQLLTGRQALNMVRFRASSDESIARSYRGADIRRVEVQQDFMAYVIPQLLTRENIMGNIFSYMEIINQHVETDLEIQEAFRYVGFAADFAQNGTIRTYTLPLTPHRGSYVYMDPIATHDLVQEIFYRSSPVQEDEALQESETQEYYDTQEEAETDEVPEAESGNGTEDTEDTEEPRDE